MPVKRVYFFGAGLSKAIDGAYPTLAELTGIVLRNFADHHRSTAVMTHFETVPIHLHGNLELILSYLFSDWPWKTTAEQDLDLSLYRQLAYEICVFLKKIETNNVDDEFQVLARYLRTHQHAVITLNYDTLIESLAAKYWRTKTGIIEHTIGLLFEDVFDDERRTSGEVPYVIEDREPEKFDWRRKSIRVDREYVLKNGGEHIAELIANDQALNPKVGTVDREKIKSQLSGHFGMLKLFPGTQGYEDPKDSTTLRNRILKLHGSIDWADERSDTVRIPATDVSPARKATLPLIVPPLLDKGKHYGTQRIRDAWFSAHSSLEQANEIIIAGFSFPTTDLSVRYLFQSALRTNPDARVVVLNSGSEVSLRPAYEEVFGEASGGKLDYQYCGRDDSVKAYIRSEIIRR